MSLAPKASESLATCGSSGPEIAKPPAVVLDAVSKRYGSATVVQSVTLTVEEGEFFSLLGPSGCGKTTLLRMLAGFVAPDEGRILLRGDDVGGRPPNRRDLNMVFQNYELFPHKTVAENVAYGLKMKKVPKSERHERVAEMLGLLGVSPLAQRRTTQLSGGQQQRVALARALVNKPAVLLLDEPLSALDVKLRKRMQEEMKSIQHKLGTTFVYVTHDQDEAMRMSDRIGIMRSGVLLQVATPREIYERPAERFVADFVGRLNELCVTVEAVEADQVICRCVDGGRLAFRAETTHTRGDEVRLAVRPERICITDDDSAVGPGSGTSLPGTVTDVLHLGPVTDVTVAVAGLGGVLTQTLTGSEAGRLSTGDRVRISWPLEAAFVLRD